MDDCAWIDDIIQENRKSEEYKQYNINIILYYN